MSITAYEAKIKLAELYRLQTESNPSRYLRAHSTTSGAILRQVEAAKLYMPYVSGRVLDWGCAHAVDACLVRMHLGPNVEIHGCDRFDPDAFPVFHEFARLRYKQIPLAPGIPYADGAFDTVISDGVLEHVANDYESLKELYRVLRPDGTLIITCLPNCYSWLEFLARRLRMPHHLRTYSMGEVRSMLLHSGFEVLRQRYLQMTPTLSGAALGATPRWLKVLASVMWRTNWLLQSLWPINRLSSNLFLVARKRLMISWSRKAA
jgi:SAM-dependent methyltransferase